MQNEKFAIIGLGYVGLPVAIGFARAFGNAVGFDVDRKRVDELSFGLDRTGECDKASLLSSNLRLTDNPEELRQCTFFIVAVPTPVDSAHRPDLRPLERACATVGKVMSKGAVIVFESTVYPGVTEDHCGPLLEMVSGLECGVDFKLGYSPERINPGDKQRRLETIVKVVAAQDQESQDRVANAYAAVVSAGVHRAPSIKVAEAAKVIENTQRDLNIALMNELAMIFERMDISTSDVLQAAGTKWNFLKFTPGLVGGHCIGVDPYYLTAKAEQLGYHPQVILAGRRINDGMGKFIAQKAIKLLASKGAPIKGAKVGVLGLTFKEDVPDMRNSRVPDIIQELTEFGVKCLVHDPLADPCAALEEYGVCLDTWGELSDLDGMVLAVCHDRFLKMGSHLYDPIKKEGVVVDVKAVLNPADVRPDLTYWRL